MAISVTAEDASNTGDPFTKSLTVPADTTSAVVITDYYPDLTTPTVTLGGVSPSYSNVYPNNDSTAFYVWNNPPTGAQTVSIDYSPQAPSNGTPAFAYYVKGAKPFDNVSWYQNAHSGYDYALSGTINGIASGWLVIRYTGAYAGVPGLEDGWENLGTTADTGGLYARASYKIATGTSITATGNSTDDYPVLDLLAFEPLGTGSAFYIESVSPTKLFSGLTNVVITGVGFGNAQGTSKVLLDGVEQSVDSWSDTSIQFDVVDPTVWATVRTLEVKKGTVQHFVYPPARSLTILGKKPMEAYYETTFPNDENPLSEGGVWFNRTGTFSAMRSNGGNALITHDGITDPNYDDSIAHLEGFPPDHYIEVVVFKTGGAFANNQEIELHVRCQTWPNLINSYEILVNPDGGSPGTFRWEGDTDETFYTSLSGSTMYLPSLANNDILRAEIIGNIITLYQNGTNRGTVNIASISGNVFSTGNPGIGGFTRDITGEQNERFGFASVKAGSL